jgi:hypothetical protein
MYNNDFEENINNQEEVKEEIKQNEVEKIPIPNQENYNKEEVKEQIKEEKKKSVENTTVENGNKKKRTYKDFGLTPAQVLKFTKIAENDLKLEEIVKTIKKYAKELGVEDTKFFLQKIEEDIKNNFEKKSFESLKPKEEKK